LHHLLFERVNASFGADKMYLLIVGVIGDVLMCIPHFLVD